MKIKMKNPTVCNASNINNNNNNTNNNEPTNICGASTPTPTPTPKPKPKPNDIDDIKEEVFLKAISTSHAYTPTSFKPIPK